MSREAKVLITSENKSQAGIRSAKSDLLGFGDAAKKVGDTITNAFTVLAIAKFAKEVAAFGFDAVKAFGEVERKMTQLKVALGGNEDSFARMNDHIQSLSRVSLSSKGDIQSLVAQLAALGKSDADIERISGAAVNLSNVTGQGLNEAMKQVNATFSGSTEELGKLVPELRGLTKEQLASGAAVDTLNTKFGALSKEMAEGASQRLKYLNDDFVKLKENIGERMLVAFDPFLKVLNETVLQLSKLITKWKELDEAVIDIEQNGLEASADSRRIVMTEKLRVARESLASLDQAKNRMEESERQKLINLRKQEIALYEQELRLLSKETALNGSLSAKPPRSTAGYTSGATAGGGSGPGSEGQGDGAPVDLLLPYLDKPIFGPPLPPGYDPSYSPEEEKPHIVSKEALGPDSLGLLGDMDLGGLFMDFIGGFESMMGPIGMITELLNPLGVILKGVFEVIGPLIEEALQPLMDVLLLFGGLIGKTLAPVIQFFAKIIKGIADGIVWMINAVIKAINWVLPKKWEIGLVSLPSSSGDARSGSGSGSGAGASYTGSQPITFNFFNQGNVVGAGGLEELAALIESIIRRNERYA